LSKRGIANALLPDNFSDYDIIAGNKDGSNVCFIQVKACQPDRATTFFLHETDESWAHAPENQYVVFVWLGSPKRNESPRYWVATKRDVGKACVMHPAHGTTNWERRFSLKDLDPRWENNWSVFDSYLITKTEK
jgi:hypothetical protein